ncbi:MAG: peptidoglycan DD-metalloendopeptidase family protein [Oscillospiraceae bacterium]
MMFSKFIKKVASTALAVAIIGISIPFSTVVANADDYKSQLNDLNSKYDQLEKEQKKIKNDISKAKTEKEKQIAQKNQIGAQIDLTKGQIGVLEEKISILTDNINEKQSMIEHTTDEINSNYDLFTKRLRAIYMTGETSTLGLVLGADSFSELLTRMEVVGRISEHDTTMLKRLIEQRKNIEEIKSQLNSDMTDLESSKEEMVTKKSQLDGEIQDVNKQIQDISALEAQFQNDNAKLQKELAEVQKEIEKVYDQINSTGVYVGGIFTWPVPTHSLVTSNYGWRFNGTDYHTGIDIAGSGAYGKNIVAANTGTVAFVQTTYVPGRGYGKYIIIDHGGGITTLYGHTSQIYVNVGDTVSRGQAIAAVGSTGWSTGPHLHFEVRVNKKHVNPWTYLK